MEFWRKCSILKLNDMRNYIYILFIIFALTSCEDFLVESPKSQIAVHQYFQSQEDAVSTVNSIYRVGAMGTFADPGQPAKATGIMSGLFSDHVWFGGQIGQYGQELSFDAERSSSVFYGLWQGHYNAISRANMALKYIPGIENIPEVLSNRLLAEARFFRALNYFALVKDFGDVPLVLEPVESLEGIFVARDNIQAVYDAIVSDLNWALENGGLSKTPFTLNDFRITHGAAETLLAEVRLQMAGYPLQDTDSYALAAQAARSVIQSGEYELIEHGQLPEESAYNKIRTSDVEREYILTIEHNADITENNWPRMSFPPGILFPGQAYIGNIGPGYEPTARFLRIYDPDLDLRIQNQQFFYSSIEIDGSVITWEDQAGPMVWYWFDEEAAFETALGGQDVKITRYPLVLLIAAEAIARTEGVTSEAVGYLTDVRSRAYWQTDRSDIESSLSGLSVQEFVEEVWKEKLRELALDFKTWDELRRTRKYPVTSIDNPGEVTFIDLVGADNGWGATFQEHHLIYPIPLAELDRNEELVQNPGYN